MLSRVFWVLVVLASLLASCSHFGKVQRSKSLDDKLKAAIAYYDKKDYYKAGVLLDEITPFLKGKEGAETAQYYQAWVAFHERDYLLSAFYFKDFYTTFIRSDRAEEAMFMHAKSLYKDAPRSNLDQTSSYDALDAFDKFNYRYPYSKFQAESQEMMLTLEQRIEKKSWDNAAIYAKVGQHKAAIIALNNFMKDFPGSTHSEKAMYMMVQEQFHYAKKSVYGKVQMDRYLMVIDFYRDFTGMYPNSGFNHHVEHYKNAAEAEILELKEYLTYTEITSVYQYAKNAIGSVKTSRYKDLLKKSDAFLNDYPKSKYRRKVVAINEDCREVLATTKK